MARKLFLLATILCVFGLALPGSSTVFVKVGGVGNGTSWANAFGQIQPGIDAAFAKGGDQVWVAYGTYEKVLVLRDTVKLYGGFKGTEVNLSERLPFLRNPDPFASIIDGEGTGSAVTVAVGATASTLLDGFTIINGNSEFGGGGVLVYQASPVISHNTIMNNFGSRGAGIYLVNSAAVCTDNLITGNESDGWGGGISVEGVGSPFIGYNTISYNSAAYYGAGVDIEFQANPCVVFNNILNNQAGFDGGGIFVLGDSWPNISVNWIIGNTAGLHGGGIYVTGSSPSISRNWVTQNSALGSGGGMYIYDYSTPVVTDNIVTSNTAKEYGGGIAIWWYSTPTLTNNTIASNTAKLKGGGLALLYKSQANVWNNIIAFNSSGVYAYSSKPVFAYNDVYNPAGVNYTGLTPLANSANIATNPLFVNLGTGDYHLAAGSPCINKGSNVAPWIPAVDYSGNPRIVGGTVDMGAYESVFLSPIKK